MQTVIFVFLMEMIDFMLTMNAERIYNSNRDAERTWRCLWNIITQLKAWIY